MCHTCELTNDLVLVPALGKHASIQRQRTTAGMGGRAVCGVRDKNETSQISLTSENRLSQGPSASEYQASSIQICRFYGYVGLPAARISGSGCLLLGSKEKI